MFMQPMIFIIAIVFDIYNLDLYPGDSKKKKR